MPVTSKIHPNWDRAADPITDGYSLEMTAKDVASLQAAATLRACGHEVDLVDAYALPGSGLAFRPDGRAHLGAPTAEVAARCEPAARGADLVVVALTPFHRPPAAMCFRIQRSSHCTRTSG